MRLSHRPLPEGLDPAGAFERLRALPGALLLESTDRGLAGGRHSFVTADPFATISATSGGGATVAWADGRREVHPGPPLWVLDDLLERFRAPARLRPEGVPFPGGAAGWLAYEVGRTFEELPAPRGHDPHALLLELGLYDVVLGWDHVTGESWIVSTGFPEEQPDARRRRVTERRQAFLARLSEETPARREPRFDERPPPAPACPALHPVPELPGVRSTFSPREYLDAVERIRRAIRAGDIFQANLSQRFQAPFRDDPFELHRRLAASHRAPYAAFLETGAGTVVSASPESFLKVRGRRVEARPIKGTAPRGRTPEDDEALARGLLASEKDRAENVMIVDLLRNDLSRACEPGSVRATAVCVLESHPTVHHLVSTVEGRLAAGAGPVDVLEAAFPGGSITGAPKLRAMEILAELEPAPRGVYTGSIGWLGFDGDFELSIAIRTVLVRDGTAYVQAGGGIVLDSDPEAEWRESVEKVRGILDAIAGSSPQERGPGGIRRASGAAVEPALSPESAPDPLAGEPRSFPPPRVALLDQRDSFAHNLARYLRELGSEVRVFRADRASLDELRAESPTHLVLSPGPCTPREFPLSVEAVRWFAGRVPILGVCLGHLCIAGALGGGWRPAAEPRHGKASRIRHRGEGLFRGVTDPLQAGLYHSLAVATEDLPAGFRLAAWTEAGGVMAIEDPSRRIWGLQFHPESVLTPEGRTILGNFLAETTAGPAGPRRPIAERGSR